MKREYLKCSTLSAGLLIVLAAFTIIAAPSVADDKKETSAAPALITPKDRMSYSLGAEAVRGYMRQGIDVDIDLVIRGMKDAAADKLLMSDADIKSSMIDYRSLVMVRYRGEKLATGQKNKEEG